MRMRVRNNVMIGAFAISAMLACRSSGAGPDPAEGHGVSGPVQLLDLRGPAQELVRQARPRDRASEHAEFRGAAQRPRQGRSSDRARRGRQCGRHGRRSPRPTSPSSPAATTASTASSSSPRSSPTPTARQDRGGGRAQHGVRVADVQDAARTTVSTRATTRSSRSAARRCGSRR